MRADGSESLWDLMSDPGEYIDVAADPGYRETLAEMRHALLRKVVETERPLERIWPY